MNLMNQTIKPALCLLLTMSLATSCTQDDNLLPEGKYPLILNAEGLSMPAASDTRTPFEGDWESVEYIAVAETSADGSKNIYKVAPDTDYSTAKLSPQDEDNTIWWNNTGETKTIAAWHPYTADMPQEDGTWSVSADQSAGIPVNEDLLYADGQIAFSNRLSTSLAFRHLLTKVVINIRSDYLQDYSPDDVTVTMGNMYLNGTFQSGTWGDLILTGTEGGTGAEVTPHRRDQAATGCFATYEALVMPQSVTGRNKTITIQVGDVNYVWTINMAGWNIEYPQDSFASGSQYTFNITLNPPSLALESNTITQWTDTGESKGSATL